MNVCRSRIWPGRCPVLFCRNCCRDRQRGTRVTHQTHTFKHTRLGAARFKCNLVGLTMEQLLWSSRGFLCFASGQWVFVEGDEKGQRLIIWRRGEHVFFISFPRISAPHLTASAESLTAGYRIQTDNFLFWHSSVCPEGSAGLSSLLTSMSLILHSCFLYEFVVFIFLFHLLCNWKTKINGREERFFKAIEKSKRCASLSCKFTFV